MRTPIAQLDSQSQELKAIEKELRDKALIFRSDVESLIKTAYATFSQAIYKSALDRLRLILEAYETESLRKPDPFRPYGPEQLLNQGDFYFMDQMDE